MKTETKRIILPPEKDLRSILDEEEKSGWKFKSNKIAIVVTLEREVPDQPPTPPTATAKPIGDLTDKWQEPQTPPDFTGTTRPSFRSD